MKTMVTLQKLIDDVENDTLNPEITLIDAESIAVLNENYDIHPGQTDLEGQEDQ